MLFKSKLPLLLLFVLLFVYASIAVEDPELKQCMHQCKVLRHVDESQIEHCLQLCEAYHREKKQKEHEKEEGDDVLFNPESPQERLHDCLMQCERGQKGQEEKQSCHKQCKQMYEQEMRHGGHQEEEEQKQKHEENPYVFEDQHFSTSFKSQHGRVSILQKFTDRSKLLRGIENYRISILEADPQTFIVPNHWDAEVIAFVANGRGTVSMVWKDKRESFNIKCGDIVRIPSGTTTYLINRDDKEKLILAKLVQPVSTPGNMEAFFGAAGEHQESYYMAFSNNILKAAFNIDQMDQLQSLFGQQKKGIFMKASQEQIKAMSRHEGGIWPFGGDSKDIINLFKESPSQQNEYGRLYEACPEDHRELNDLNIAVSYLNLTKGAMAGPMYYSKATKISIVMNGEGYFEMACPHMSSQQENKGEQRKGGIKYQKISSPLRRGTVVVIPAGHPFVTVASNDQNLEVVCFEVNARNNQRVSLVGKNSVVSQFEREAKELAFSTSSRDVDQVFGKQEGEYFFKGPKEQHQGHAEA